MMLITETHFETSVILTLEFIFLKNQDWNCKNLFCTISINPKHITEEM